MLDGIKEIAGNQGKIDIYLHHFNFNIFKSFIEDAKGHYTHYIISPWDHKRMGEVISVLPETQTYIIDGYTLPFIGIRQDFSNNIYELLKHNLESIKKYQKLIFLFRDTTTQPPVELMKGFKRFSNKGYIDCEIKQLGKITEINKGEAWIVIDDNDLVDLVLLARKKEYKLGKQLGILSYNESKLKKVISNGISTISTDFKAMGEKLATMILANDRSAYINPCRYIDRGSF